MQLRDDRDVYNEYHGIVRDNPDLDKSNEFLVLIEAMYFSHILVALRRFDDRDARSHSIRNLIAELREHRERITKEWFVGQYPQESRAIAERDWVPFSGAGPCLCERVLREDLGSLTEACRNIRPIVNKHIGHTDRKRSRLQVSYREINQAVDTVCDLVVRYYRLLYAQEPSWPSPRAWAHIFKRPWIASHHPDDLFPSRD